MVLLVAAGVRAEGRVGDASIVFDADAAPSSACPDESSFIAAIAGATRRSLEASGEAPPRLVFKVAVTSIANGFEGRVRLSTSSAEGTRHRFLRGATCREVAEGLALIVSLSIDPELDIAEPIPIAIEHLSSPKPLPASSAKRAPAAAESAPALAPEAGSFRFAAELAGLGSAGSAPSMQAGAVIGAIVSLADAPRSSVIVEGAAFATVTQTAATGAVDFHALQARATLCPIAAELGPRIELAPCIGAAFTRLSTTSSGFGRNTPTAVSTLSASAGARERVGLSRNVGAFFHTEVFYTPSQEVWYVEGYGAIFQSSRFGARGMLGVDWRF
jgi:hypothetical protein